MTPNSQLMKQARETLSGKWRLAIGAMFVSFLIGGIAGSIPKVGSVIGLLIGGALSLGVALFSLSFSRNQNPHFEQIFEGFKRYGVSLGAHILMILFVVLWSLLLIVPGIIAAFAYSMTFFIIADNPSIGPREAIQKSRTMMKGYKWKLFCLDLRFLGWALLSILTIGIGFLWLLPYIQISMAKFYDDIKNQQSIPQTI